MRRFIRENVVLLAKHVTVPIFLFFLLAQLVELPALAQKPAKELPMLVTLTDLQAEPAQYDGHRIVVTGRVRSIEIQRGRRGSEYVMLVLEDETPGANSSQPMIRVVSFSPPTVQQGHHALVQGTYHVEGRQAGRPFENFIDAEVILKEKL